MIPSLTRSDVHPTLPNQITIKRPRIPVDRHSHADELIFIQSGTGKVTLGGKVQFAHAGAIVFTPRDTWIGMGNVGNDRLKRIDVWSAPGFQESISVPIGQPIVPLSKAEVEDFVRGFRTSGFISEINIIVRFTHGVV